LNISPTAAWIFHAAVFVLYFCFRLVYNNNNMGFIAVYGHGGKERIMEEKKNQQPSQKSGALCGLCSYSKKRNHEAIQA